MRNGVGVSVTAGVDVAVGAADALVVELGWWQQVMRACLWVLA